MRLHYAPGAADAATWRDATGISAGSSMSPLCSMRPRGNHSGGILMATSRADAVTCAKCRAALTD